MARNKSLEFYTVMHLFNKLRDDAEKNFLSTVSLTLIGGVGGGGIAAICDAGRPISAVASLGPEGIAGAAFVCALLGFAASKFINRYVGDGPSGYDLSHYGKAVERYIDANQITVEMKKASKLVKRASKFISLLGPRWVVSDGLTTIELSSNPRTAPKEILNSLAARTSTQNPMGFYKNMGSHKPL